MDSESQFGIARGWSVAPLADGTGRWRWNAFTSRHGRGGIKEGRAAAEREARSALNDLQNQELSTHGY